MSETAAQKQKRERSKAYPGTNLADCVNYVRQIKTNLGRGVHDRESLAKAIGFEKATGGTNSKIAALVHFGFLDRAEGGYQLSDNAQKITDPISESETKDELRAAFHRPALYQELIQKFQTEGQIPTQLATHLHRFHGITQDASKPAADVFLESGKFADVIDESNRFSNKESFATDPDQATHQTTRTSDDATGGNGFQSNDVRDEIAEPTHLAGASPTQRFQFTVTGGRNVVMIVPSDITEKDIKIIRKQVELLELQAGIEAESE